jgi:hypothetical protein
MEVNGQFHVPDILKPRQWVPSTDLIGAWEDPSPEEDSVQKSTDLIGAWKDPSPDVDSVQKTSLLHL